MRLLAREAKALAPSAVLWAAGRSGGRLRCAATVGRAVRSPDPRLHLNGAFVVRRLAPSSTRIDLAELPREHHAALLEAMGASRPPTCIWATRTPATSRPTCTADRTVG